MLPQEIIKNKRDGRQLSQQEIDFFVAGITDESISEGQIAAMAMAIYFNGMVTGECRDLTNAMVHSGDVLDWSALNGPVIDKHSTGGVGDKVSLMLAPIIAACGGFVPMISGRGLGHTGGTLDKLEAIPGYNTQLSNQQFKQVVAKLGCSIIGQTSNLAPADKRVYATRDITATVDSIPLITASILSKKVAAGLDALVMDVKCGNGAFASDFNMAKALAESLVSVAPIPTKALITDMNQVLGHTAGHSLEVQETIEYLTRTRVHPRLHELVMQLSSQMLVLGGLAADLNNANLQIMKVLDTGMAAEKFAQMVAAHGGPKDLIEKPQQHCKPARWVAPVFAAQAGYVAGMDCRQLGLSIINLGGGRKVASDAIDPAVGYSDFVGVGEWVDADRPLAMIHANSQDQRDAAKLALQQHITTTPEEVESTATILTVI